jgi:hypothetical protein
MTEHHYGQSRASRNSPEEETSEDQKRLAGLEKRSKGKE